MKSIRERLSKPTSYEPRKVEIKSTKEVDLIIEHWESIGFKKVQESTIARKTTVSYIKKLKKGTLYNKCPFFSEYHNKKFTGQEIIMAIDNFALATFDSDYKPLDKTYLKKLPFYQFIFSPYATRNKSLFLDYYEDPPEFLIQDGNVKLTECLWQLYRKEILGGSEVVFSSKTRDKFILASKNLREFFDKNKGKVRIGYAVNAYSMTRWLFESIVRETKREKIVPGYFCSNETFSRRLPQYLYLEGILK